MRDFPGGPESDPSRPPWLRRARLLGAVTLASATFGCEIDSAAEGGAGPFDDALRQAVIAAVDSATWSFHAAEIAREAEAVVAHIAPDFYMYGDGVRSEYDDVVAGIRATMPTLRVFHAEWSDLEVRALGRDAAVVSFLFRDSIVAANGDISVQRGPSTLVWERRGDDWLIVYVDADHYPPE